jgi:hypothetical protein
MQLSTLFLMRPHIANDDSSQSVLLSTSPLCVESQFPREAAISIVLVFLSLFLITLGTEACLKFTSMALQPDGLNLQTILWFLGYAMANLLFFLHGVFYFTYRETIRIFESHLEITQSLGGFSTNTRFEIQQILCANLSEGFLGTHRLEVLTMDSAFQVHTHRLGMCLSREHLELLGNSLKVRILNAV